MAGWNPDYYVAVAAAGPVIALAQSVLAPQALGVLGQLAHSPIGPLKKKYDTQATIVFSVLFVSFLAQFVATALALVSLRHERDWTRDVPGLPGLLVLLGFLATGVCAVQISVLTVQVERATRAHQQMSGRTRSPVGAKSPQMRARTSTRLIRVGNRTRVRASGRRT